MKVCKCEKPVPLNSYQQGMDAVALVVFLGLGLAPCTCGLSLVLSLLHLSKRKREVNCRLCGGRMDFNV